MTALAAANLASWRKTLIAAGLGLCVLLLGCVIGAGLAVLHFRSGAAGGGAARIGAMMSGSLAESVALSPGEKAHIDEILTAGMGDVEKFDLRYGAAIRGSFDAMCGKICAVLGHERSKDWEEYVRREYGEKAATMIQHCRAAVAAGDAGMEPEFGK